MTAVITDRITGRSLIPQELFERLVSRIVADDGKTYDLAAKIMDQALAFLGTCARHHSRHLTPSELVDIGWHTFILYTWEYDDFCQRIAGRFLHHVPADGDPPRAARPPVRSLRKPSRRSSTPGSRSTRNSGR